MPAIQTKIGSYVTNELRNSYGVDINVDRLSVNVFGGIKLKGVLIKDHHQDTLVYSKSIHTHIIGLNEVLKGNLIFGDLKADKLTFFLKTYKGEGNSNINVFVEKFKNDKPKSDVPFILKSSNLQVIDGHFRVENQNAQTPVSVEFKQLNGELDDFFVVGSEVGAKIKHISFLENRGVFLSNLSGDFLYTDTRISLENLKASTKEKTSLIGTIFLDYQSGGLSNFTDEVNITLDLKPESKLASTDIYYFYKELANGNVYDFHIKAKGTLNDFITEDLYLANQDMTLNGDLYFKNIVAASEREFLISGDVTELRASNQDLKKLLPNILGQKLPNELDQFGKVVLNGKIKLTKSDLELKSNIVSAIGNATTDFILKGFSDTTSASYSGWIQTSGINIGRLIKNNLFGKVSGKVTFDGKGFDKKSLNTYVSANLNSFYLNKYNYKNILIDANLSDQDYYAEVHLDDPNAKLSFIGELDLSSSQNKYKIDTQLDYVDLNKLKVFTRDSISILKGNFKFNGYGNKLDAIGGKLNISDASYQNHNDIYFFNEVEITSNFDENNVRTLIFDSQDIIQGELKGRYSFVELPKIVSNALGSLYTNYSAYKIQKNQFLKFNFTFKNKIFEVIYPDLKVSKNTVIRGDINPDQEIFKLNLSSPRIEIGENKIHKLKFNIDNKNPLYTAYIETDSITNKLYKISDFGLINFKNNDTLYFRTEFKGGKKSDDFYNLNLYYTINKEKQSVVGFQKSELNFKDYLWYLNESDSNNSKLVFNKSLSDITIDNFVLSHNEQFIQLGGLIKGSDKKDINLNLKNVDLYKITPEIENLRLEGLLNGYVNLYQDQDIFKPTASIEASGLAINKIPIGDLHAEVQGDETFKRFGINAYIFEGNNDLLSFEGDLEVVNKQTIANLDIRLNKFNLSPFSDFGKGVISNLRGFATGRTTVVGNLKNPEVSGRLFLDKSGLKIPYLNTDFNFDDNTIVDITNSNIFFRQVNLTDTKYRTRGILNGTVTHKLFTDFGLDLDLSTDRLLILDTEDSEDAMFYGTAFIKGTGSIKGPTSALVITANVTSDKGTSIKIPISDSKSAGEASYINFLSPEEKYNKGVINETSKFVTSGLELELNLNVTPDAEIDIILDRETGHAIRGGRGNGMLEMDISTLGRFSMNGIFTVEEGRYDFRFENIIKKEFNVKRGGTITWSGDPKLAFMNIQAVYTTEANPSILLDNPSFNRRIPVNLIIDVRGTLEALQEPNFNIEFPSVSSVLQSEIQYKLADDDTRRTQAFALLATRNFIGSQGMSSGALAGSLTETASSLFSNLLSDEDNIFQIGVDYTVANRDPNNTKDADNSDRLGINLSTQINEDITINGKLGVPVGGSQQSVVVGNVEILLRLNEDRTLNARVFNRENDVNYFGEGIGYTQGIGITWEVDFDSFKELVNRIFINERKRKRLKEESVDNSHILELDTDFNKEYLKFIEQRGKKKQIKPKENIERAPDPF